MSSPQLTPPPPVSPPPSASAGADTLRPRRRWYLVARLIVVVAFSLGAYLLTFRTDVPQPTPEFVGQIQREGDASFSVGEFESGDWGLYASPGASARDCALNMPDPASRPGGNISGNELRYETDDGEWELVGVLDTGVEGVHTLYCSGSVQDRYAIGSMDAPRDADTSLAVAVIGGIMIPIFSFFAALIMCFVVFLLRSSRKADIRREQALRQYAATYGGPPPPPPARVYGGPPPRSLPLSPIDPREIRPRARWFWIGGLSVPGGLVAGILVLVLANSWGERLPEFVGVIEDSGSITFEAQEGEEEAWGLYVSPRHTNHHAACDPGQGLPSRFKRTGTSFATSNDDGWRLVATIDTPEPGEYTLTCDADPDVRFAVADQTRHASAPSAFTFGLVSLLVLAPAGFVFGLTTIIVTAVRRERHRALLVRKHRDGIPFPNGAPG